MATRTITTKLVLDGEAEYRAKLKNINAELALQKSELEKIQAQYKNSANSMEALSAKEAALKGQITALNEKHREQSAMLEQARQAQQKYAQTAEELKGKLEGLAGSAEDTSEEQKKLQEEIDAAEAAMQKAANSVTYYQKQLNNTERDQAKLSTELDKTGQYLDEAAHSADGCAHSIDQYGKEVKQAGDSSEQFGSTSKEAVNQLAAALAAAGVAKSVKEIADALMECSTAASGFETALAKLSTLMIPQSMEHVKASLMELSTETGVEVGLLAEAAYQARSAGVDVAEVIDFVSTAVKTSTAGFTDSASAVNVLTTAINAYNLEGSKAERVASMLVKAQDEGKTSVNELAQNMGRVIPVAAAYNVNLGNLSTAYAILTKNGTNTAISTTNLSALFTELARDGSNVANALRQETGQSFAQLMDSGSNLGEIMSILSESVDNDTTAFSNLWSSTTAAQAALSLLNSGADEFTRILGVMESSSGAVEQNFQAMANTTEHAQQRMVNAAQNLKIAIGDRLNPALNDLYASGTDAFTWATEFVSENEWIVSVIVGLTSAVGALVAGFAGFSILKTITPMITAFNTALAANPIGAVAIAVVGVVAALGTLAATMENTSGETKEFTKSLKESKQAYEELQDAMDERQGSTKATADALKDLLAVENKSAVQKEELKLLIDQLNEAVPGLGLAYDAEKDALEGLTAAEVDSALERVAAQEEYQAQVERLAQLRTEQTEIDARLTEAEDQLSAAYESGATHADAYSRASGGAGAAVRNAEAAVRTLTSAFDENAAEIAALEEATNAYAQRQQEENLAIETMTARVDDLTVRMQSLEEEYQKSYDAAMESLNSQMGLFQEMDGSAKTSIDSLINTLKGQVAYMDEYAANIKKAMELGVDEGLVKKLSDGSEQSAQILDAIVNGGEEDIAALNEQFAKVEEGKEAFSDTVAQMETDFDEKMGEIVNDLNEAIDEMNLEDKAYEMGVNNVQGLVAGTADPAARQALIREYQQMARDALAAYKREVQQASPSKKFNETAQNDIQGLIQGAEAKRAALAAAYEGLAKVSMESYANGVQNNLEAVSEAMAQFDGAVKDLDSFYDLQANVRDLEYQLWERTEGKTAAETEKYARQLELLKQKQADQQKVVDAAAAAYEAAVEQYGEGTEGSYKYQQALLQEKLALQELLEEIEKVTAAKQELDRQAFMEQAQARWESSGLGLAQAAAQEAGYITPYEASRISGSRLVLPDGSTYQSAAQSARNAIARNQQTLSRELPARQDLGRQMEAISAATVNAIASVAQRQSPVREVVRLVTVDGKELASATFDSLVDYGDSNGTPIVNRR